MSKGYRMIDGRQYSLDGRFTGWDARERAVAEAARMRAQGHLARISKVWSCEYTVHSHRCGDGKGGRAT